MACEEETSAGRKGFCFRHARLCRDVPLPVTRACLWETNDGTPEEKRRWVTACRFGEAFNVFVEGNNRCAVPASPQVLVPPSLKHGEREISTFLEIFCRRKLLFRSDVLGVNQRDVMGEGIQVSPSLQNGEAMFNNVAKPVRSKPLRHAPSHNFWADVGIERRKKIDKPYAGTDTPENGDGNESKEEDDVPPLQVYHPRPLTA